MTDYIFLMRGGDARALNLSEEEMNTHMQDWKEYMESLGATGKLRGGGAPLALDGLTISGESKSEHSEQLGGNGQVNGYMLLAADNVDEANALARNCPIFTFGGSLEIRECVDMSS